MINTTDVAYLVALLEKAPSTYPRRKQIIDELQRAWKNSADRGRQPWHIPVAIGEISVIASGAEL
jgi:hypothetical protein